MIRENKMKRIFSEGKYAVGTFVKINDPSSIEALGICGFDFVVIDNEHVSMSKQALVDVIRAAELTGLVPIVRVRENSPVEILQALDSGALGVQIPQVNTKEDAKIAVGSCKYEPRGNRGFAPSHRAAGYGTMNIYDYIQMSNDNTLVVCHCETVECMNNLDEILKEEDLDVVFIGPMDLSQSMGIIGEGNNPKLIEAIDSIIDKVIKAGKAVGTVAPNEEKAKEYIEKGVQFITISSDLGMITTVSKNIIKSLKGE